MKLKLTINIDYCPDGVTESELRDLLDYAANSLASEGRFTGDTPATVNSWNYDIVKED